MPASSVLITLSSCLISLCLPTDANVDCQPGYYYDPITVNCHPCSDCSNGRTSNAYCEKGCTAEASGHVTCEYAAYYDPLTQRCHPCSECDYPRPPNRFCLAQCKALTSPTTTTAAKLRTLPATDTGEKILIIVFPSVLGVIVLVLAVLGVLTCVRYCRRTTAVRETVVYEQTTENEENHGNGISIIVPSGGDAGHFVYRSLPVTLNDQQQQNHIRGQVPNSSSETRLMNARRASTVQFQSDETVPLRLAASPGRSSCVELQEEFDAQYSSAVTRLNSSLSGYPVCHPEQEDLTKVAPTLVNAAAGPHVSLDPDKPCDAACGETSSVASVSETFCKCNG